MYHPDYRELSHFLHEEFRKDAETEIEPKLYWHKRWSYCELREYKSTYIPTFHAEEPE
jgi:hypothetical protein